MDLSLALSGYRTRQGWMNRLEGEGFEVGLIGLSGKGGEVNPGEGGGGRQILGSTLKSLHRGPKGLAYPIDRLLLHPRLRRCRPTSIPYRYLHVLTGPLLIIRLAQPLTSDLYCLLTFLSFNDNSSSL